ncbi:MAG: hypothetical protein M0P01_04705 [Treponema sp.]|nr:hypothetical protein [Treponema sp.]
MNKNIRAFLLWFLQVAGICSIVLSAVCPVSCKVTDEGLQLLHGDYTAPAIESYSVKDAFSVVVIFSKKVQITDAVIVPASETTASDDAIPSLENASESDNAVQGIISYDEAGKSVTISSTEKRSVGAHYKLYGEAADGTGNTLTFCIPFTGYNDRMAHVLISEIHPGYVSGSNRCEFVELFVLTEGNLAGLEVYSANDGKDRGYVLPAAEVKPGDVIILHMRKKGESCIDETGDDLSAAEGTTKADYVSSKARDLWADNTKACIGDKEDVIVLLNSFSGNFIDAVLYAPAGIMSWTKDEVQNAAEAAVSEGIWHSAGPSDAVKSDGLTATKTFARKGCLTLLDNVRKGSSADDVIAQSSDEWYIADSKKVSPGTVE